MISIMFLWAVQELARRRSIHTYIYRHIQNYFFIFGGGGVSKFIAPSKSLDLLFPIKMLSHAHYEYGKTK
jgi:hypothetical protein